MVPKNVKSESHAERTISLLQVLNSLIIWTPRLIRLFVLDLDFWMKIILRLMLCFWSSPEMLRVRIEPRAQMNSKLKSKGLIWKCLKTQSLMKKNRKNSIICLNRRKKSSLMPDKNRNRLCSLALWLPPKSPTKKMGHISSNTECQNNASAKLQSILSMMANQNKFEATSLFQVSLTKAIQRLQMSLMDPSCKIIFIIKLRISLNF